WLLALPAITIHCDAPTSPKGAHPRILQMDTTGNMGVAGSWCKQGFSFVVVQKKRSNFMCPRVRAVVVPATRVVKMHRLPHHKSSTSRGPFERDTQTIIVLLAARSSGESSASRCSGSPERTRVSHVPQMPSSHALGISK